MTKTVRRRTYKILGAIVAASAATTGVGMFRAPSLNADMVDEVETPGVGDRLLVFAPHCDDEILGTGGLILSALENGADVKVVVLTNGDNNIFSTDIEFKTLYPSPKTFVEAGVRRQEESIEGLRVLGVSEEDVFFLGFPDKGLRALYEKRWDAKKPYRSRATEVAKAPYGRIYEPKVAYAGENVLRNIKEITAEYSPTTVVGPHLDDRHPDHRYGARFVLRALDEMYGPAGKSAAPTLLTYLVHHPRYPRPVGLRPEDLLLPPFESTFDMGWKRHSLSEGDVERKWEAIRSHKSQLKVPELKTLMRSFVRKNELFEAVYDFRAYK